MFFLSEETIYHIAIETFFPDLQQCAFSLASIRLKAAVLQRESPMITLMFIAISPIGINKSRANSSFYKRAFTGLNYNIHNFLMKQKCENKLHLVVQIK